MIYYAFICIMLSVWLVFFFFFLAFKDQGGLCVFLVISKFYIYIYIYIYIVLNV